MEERGLRRTSAAPTATKRSRIGHRLLLKMGLRKRGFCPVFDTAHENYTWLKHYVEEMQESLSAYALQLARMTEAARGLGEDASHLYSIRDRGFKPVVAFKEAQDKGHNGYAGQLQQAFVKGVIEPVGKWHSDLESLEKLVTNFDDIRIQHDHYRLKVEDLAQKAKSLEARATTRGDSRDARHAAEKLKRNTVKLNEVTAEFDKRLSSCCDQMTKAWDEREKMMNGIVARIIHFQESFFAEQLMSGLGVSRILSEAEGRGPRWGGTAGIEPFVPKGHVRHYEGELLRKHVLIKERMWYRLVGSSLEVYDVKTKDEGPLYVVTEAPVAVHEVKGVAKITDVNFRVAILSGDGGLNLFAADAADGKGWTDALARASDWDQLTSSRKVEGCVRESRAFLNRCKRAHRDTTTSAGLEQEFGVTEALANPPPPPADRPDVKSYTAARTAGGGASATGGGGGGKEASGSGGGSFAAGIAPGGEAGIAAAAVGAAATAAAGKWKGSKGKKGKGDDGEDKIPELVKASEKKGGKGGGGGGGGGSGRGPGLTGGGRSGEIGIGGLFPGRTGRQHSMGAGPGGVPLGMMGGRGINPSTFSAAASSFGGSTHSSMNGLGGGSQMGDPRLHMSQPPPPHMGMAPPVNPTTGLPSGMTQNGPPLMLPLGMVPGGPPVINQPPPPPVMDQSMMGGMGARGPGSGWGAGPPPGGWGGGGLQQTRSFGSRVGQKPGVRQQQQQQQQQQGFRRSHSFGDMDMGAYEDPIYPPGYRGRRLSTMREDDGFDTQSTRSAPVFGATAAVGEAAAAAEAASAAAARVAAGGHVDDGRKGAGAEESKSSSKKKEGGAGAAAAAAAAAAAGAAAIAAQRAAAPSPAPSPPLPPSEPVNVPVTIETIRPKETAPAASAVSVVAVEQTNTPAAGGTGGTGSTSASTSTSSTTITHVEVPASSLATAPAPAADAPSARAAVTTVTTSAATTTAPAAPASPVYLSDRGDDGGLSRYGTSGETPARVRSKPLPTWKRMMSLGSASSSRSYRYDGGDMGVSGEAKPSAEEMYEGDRWNQLSRSKEASGLKKTRSERWPLRRGKSSVSNTSPPRGSLAPSSAASIKPGASTRSRAAATAVAERKAAPSSERRASSTGRGARSLRAGRSRAVGGDGASAAAGAKAAKATKGGAKAVSPSEDFAFDDEQDFKRAPPITRDETTIGRSTRFTTKATKKKLPASSKSSKAKEAAKAAAAAVAATAAGAAATTAAATARENSSAAAIEKAGARSASAGASTKPSTAPVVGGDAIEKGQVEAPAATVVTASDTSARPAAAAGVSAPSPIVAPGSAGSVASSVTTGPSMTPIDNVFVAVSSVPAAVSKSSDDSFAFPASAATKSSPAPPPPAAAAAETKSSPVAAAADADISSTAASAELAAAEATTAKAAAAEAADAEAAAAAKAAATKAEQDAAKYAEERKASAEAAKRVDNSTGIMKNLTLEEIMARSSGEADSTGGVAVDGTSSGGGGKSFDLAVPAVAATAGGVVATAATGISAKDGGAPNAALDSAALSSADGLKDATAGPGGSVESAAFSTRATAGDPTPVAPATKPALSEAAGCETITPAHFVALNAATTTPTTADAPAAATPRTAAKSAATAAAEASSVAEAAASAASAAAAAAALASAGVGGVSGGGGSASPPRTSSAAAATVVPALSPDTPGSTGSSAQVAAQAKVFQRLCDSSGSEAETGDAGGGVGGAASPLGDESVLSFQQLMGWDEVQELLEYGALKKDELTSLWKEAVRVQEVERGSPADPLATTSDIWGSSSSASANGGGGATRRAVAPADGSSGGGGGTTEALTQRGFMILVKLIEELQFEKELEQDKGVGLAPGRVCVV